MTTILSSDTVRPLRVLVTAPAEIWHRVVRRLAANGHDVAGLDAVVHPWGREGPAASTSSPPQPAHPAP